ncbi:hypothetical protein QQ045_013322 [Rhodiola kirilowii]
MIEIDLGRTQMEAEHLGLYQFDGPSSLTEPSHDETSKLLIQERKIMEVEATGVEKDDTREEDEQDRCEEAEAENTDIRRHEDAKNSGTNNLWNRASQDKSGQVKITPHTPSMNPTLSALLVYIGNVP